MGWCCIWFFLVTYPFIYHIRTFPYMPSYSNSSKRVGLASPCSKRVRCFPYWCTSLLSACSRCCSLIFHAPVVFLSFLHNVSAMQASSISELGHIWSQLLSLAQRDSARNTLRYRYGFVALIASCLLVDDEMCFCRFRFQPRF